MRVPQKDDAFLVANAGRMFELLSAVDQHPFDKPIKESTRLAIQALFSDALHDGIDIIAVAESGLAV